MGLLLHFAVHVYLQPQSALAATRSQIPESGSELRGSYLLRQQHRRVAVLAVGLGAQRGQSQQKEEERGGPNHQLPVDQRVQEGFVAVQQLRRE